MPNGKKAPLVEAIFEVRWGTPIRRGHNLVEFKFDEEDTTLFAGVFRSFAKADFPVYKKINENMPPNAPYLVKHQMWTGENRWPCLQTGLGIMTVNQTDVGYDWTAFRNTCVKALRFLDEAHHQSLSGMPKLGVELRYQDAFLLAPSESDAAFITERAEVILKTPEAFLRFDAFEPRVEDHHIGFTVPVKTPVGFLQSQLDRGLAGGKPAFIATTTMRSADAHCPEFSLVSLTNWLEQAHDVQHHAYETLIKPTNERGP